MDQRSQLSDDYSRRLYELNFRSYYSPQGDGNCFPRCILKELFNEESNNLIASIRRTTAENLMNNYREHEQSELTRIIKEEKCLDLNAYCRAFQLTGKRSIRMLGAPSLNMGPIWFGQFEIIEFVRDRNLQVVIYYPHLSQPLKFGDDNGIQIEIAFENNHYFLLHKSEFNDLKFNYYLKFNSFFFL